MIDDSSHYRFFTLRLSFALLYVARFPFFPPLRISFRLKSTLEFSELGGNTVKLFVDFLNMGKETFFSPKNIFFVTGFL